MTTLLKIAAAIHNTLSVQKVILLTVEEYKEMVTRIKELEEECDNLVN